MAKDEWIEYPRRCPKMTTVHAVRGKRMATNQSQYEEMCEIYERYNKGDLVPVVRCKDCRYYHVYWESNGHTEKGYGACDWINDKSVREDHFCSWGERRENENN